ncbi:MAG TPA: dihydrodipicolinate synthase family protein [Stellaceae bacterium]
MPRFANFIPSGVIPACLLPFDDDFAIDAAEYRKHLRDVAAVAGLAALTVNAHASEVHACSLDEQRRVLDITMDEVGERLPVVTGIYAESSLLAAEIAAMAERGGASALLVFPPNSMIMGGQLRPEMGLAHFRRIAAATDLPLILFQYPMASGLGYPIETLLRIVDEVPSVRAIKDWCNDPLLHERHIRTLQALPRPVNVLTTHSSWLMSSLVLRCDGLLSGAGSVIADLQAALWRAVEDKDLARAQALNDRLYPLVQVFYAPPFLDMHNRMKEALVLLGRLKRAVVRPPLVKLPDAEIGRIKEALAKARVTAAGAFGLAA